MLGWVVGRLDAVVRVKSATVIFGEGCMRPRVAGGELWFGVVHAATAPAVTFTV